MIEKYNKITPGFVIQAFEKRDEKFICVEQGFTAGDPVDRENDEGEPVDVDVRDEQYQPFEMVQPGRDYYFLYVFGGVEAEQVGPFSTEQQRNRVMEKHKKGEGREDYDSYFPFDVTKDSTVQF